MKNFPIKDIYETFESIMVSLVVITLIIVFAFRAVSVDGDSMLPNLHDQERLITTNLFYTPEKGDIVVTQDYGVAAMILSKDCYGIHQSGKVYTNDNIELMLLKDIWRKRQEWLKQSTTSRGRESVRMKMIRGTLRHLRSFWKVLRVKS